VMSLHRRHFGLRLALDCLLCRRLFLSGLGGFLMLGVLVLSEERSNGEQAAEDRTEQATIQKIQRAGPPAVKHFGITVDCGVLLVWLFRQKSYNNHRFDSRHQYRKCYSG